VIQHARDIRFDSILPHVAVGVIFNNT